MKFIIFSFLLISCQAKFPEEIENNKFKVECPNEMDTCWQKIAYFCPNGYRILYEIPGYVIAKCYTEKHLQEDVLE